MIQANIRLGTLDSHNFSIFIKFKTKKSWGDGSLKFLPIPNWMFNWAHMGHELLLRTNNWNLMLNNV
jgi:hypothetical protein